MHNRHIFLAALVASIWGLNYVVIKIGMRDVPPIFLAALRFLFASFPAIFFIRRPKLPLRVVATYGFFTFAVFFGLLFAGMSQGVTAGVASVAVQLNVFLSIGLGSLLRRERPTVGQLIGIAVASGGLLILLCNQGVDAPLLGIGLIFLGALSWAIGNLIVKSFGNVDALALVVWGSAFAWPILLFSSIEIYGAATLGKILRNLNWASLGALLYLVVPVTLFGFGAWSHLIKKYPISKVTPFSLLTPVVGVIASTLLLDESIEPWKITSAALVLAGLIINQHTQS